MQGEKKGKGSNGERFEEYGSFQSKKRNAARIDDLCRRLKKKLGRRWDASEDEGPRKAQRKSWDQGTNNRLWSVSDRIVVFQEAANEFLLGTRVWQLVPLNSRVVVVDSKLTIQQVIDALVVENQDFCAPVWDSERERFLGIVTWKALISALVKSGSSLEDFLACHVGKIPLDEMCKIIPTHHLKKVIQACMKPCGTFCVVGGTLNGGLDTSDILNVFTRRRILKFLLRQLSAHAAGPVQLKTSERDSKGMDIVSDNTKTVDTTGRKTSSFKRNLFDEILMFTVEQLSIASTHGVEIVRKGVKLKDVLTTMVQKVLPHVVILDDDGRAVEMYSRSDIRILSAEVLGVVDLDVVEAANRHRRLCTYCSKSDTLHTIMAKMATSATNGEALVCVGKDKRFEGLVSFTSLFGILETKQGSQHQLSQLQTPQHQSSQHQVSGAADDSSRTCR
ncbi:hypothetical protein AAMO2058_000607100 [Amorphochlora amoebiformis]